MRRRWPRARRRRPVPIRDPISRAAVSERLRSILELVIDGATDDAAVEIESLIDVLERTARTS